jgi:hypothetical protein
MGRRDSILNIQKTIRRTLHVKENRKHRRRAEGKSIHIQHTNKHTGKIRCDKQKKKTEIESGHKAEINNENFI